MSFTFKRKINEEVRTKQREEVQLWKRPHFFL